MNEQDPQGRAQAVNSYDELPYPGKPFSQTHPRNLATVAALFGMQPADPGQCRVLELGCAVGCNIIPMACALPDSRFIGLDLSEVQIERARSLADSLQLENLELRCADILDIDDSLGEFDYIIAHGVFSWVPFPVQQHLLRLCRQRLTGQGVAYISYNTNPGWRMRGMLRDIMLYHAGNFQDTATRIAQSRALVNFLSEALAGQDSAYAALLRDETEHMKHWEDAYFRHDSLEEVNEPVYFHEFMARAEKEGLQYLAEAEVSTMVVNNFSSKVQQTLSKVGDHIVQREQYMDFIRNRLFRQTLLCHKERPLTREIDIGLAEKAFFAADCKPRRTPVSINSDQAAEFVLKGALNFTSACRHTKAIALCMGEHWPQYLSFEQLTREALRQLQGDAVLIADAAQMQQHRGLVAARVFELYMKGLLTLSLHPPAVCRSAGERPKAEPLTRLQSQCQAWTTNLLHEPVSIDSVSRHLLPLLDGEHDRGMILERMLGLVRDQTLVVQQGGAPLTADDEQVSARLGEQIELCIQQAAQRGLLAH